MPCETRNDRDVIHLCAVTDVVLEPGRPVGARVQPGERVGPRRGERRSGDRGVRGSPPSASTIRPAQYASSSANEPLNPEQMTATSPFSRRAAFATADRLSSEPSRTTSHSDAAVRIARVPFVVVRMSVRAFGGRRELARRGPHVESLDDDRVALAADDRLVAELGAQRACLVDLRATENTLVARRQRLCDRRCRPDDVDDDADVRGDLLRGRERDIDPHADTLAAWTRPATCYRHPGPRNRPLVLRMRAAHLLRVHDAGARRAALPRPLGEAAGRQEGDERGEPDACGRRLTPHERRHAGADRDQRRGLSRRARRRRLTNGTGTGSTTTARCSVCVLLGRPSPPASRTASGGGCHGGVPALRSSTSRSTCTRSTSPARSSSR